MATKLFSYPATLPAYEAPRRHRVSVPSNGSQMQFRVLPVQPGGSILLDDEDFRNLDQSLFAEGLLIYEGATDEVGPGVHILSIPLSLADIANGTVVATPAAFDGEIAAWDFVVTSGVTTALKTTTLGIEIDGSPMQQDDGAEGEEDAALTITSATAANAGAVITGPAATSGNAFAAGDSIEVVASATTAFVEGAGVLRLVLVED